jgi:4-nitrophenyl phosphatase
VIGESGLVKTIKASGLSVSRQNPLAVIVGLDKEITYNKLKEATLLIRSGVPFIATNPDRTFPSPEGIVPGAGSIIAALEAATDVKPVVLGKPNPEMFLLALHRLGSSPQSTLVVGDRLETDIAGAQAQGCLTGLVLSGVSSDEDEKKWKPSPDFVCPDLTDLIRILNDDVRE